MVVPKYIFSFDFNYLSYSKNNLNLGILNNSRCDEVETNIML